MTLESDWLDRIKATMAIDIARGIAASRSAEQIVAMLFDIPEVAQAFELRSIATRDRGGRWTLPPAE